MAAAAAASAAGAGVGDSAGREEIQRGREEIQRGVKIALERCYARRFGHS